MTAFMGKREVPLEEALIRASDILAAARMPVIAGPGADVAGARAALRLAARIGGVLDFCRSPGSVGFLRAMMDKGLLFTTPREARARADVLLLLGPSAGRSKALVALLEGQPVLSAGEGARREVLWLCHGGAAESLSRFDILAAQPDPGALHGMLAMLNAFLRATSAAGSAYGDLTRQDFEEIAGRLITARFGVIAFAAQDLDALAIEALMTLAERLGRSTRVTLLPLVSDAPAEAAALVCAWTTGMPPRLSFGRGEPAFDLWRYDAARLAESGECDALLWFSPFEAKAPDWRPDGHVIAVTRPGSVFSRTPDIIVETGLPGAEIDAEIFSDVQQMIVSAPAARSTAAPSPSTVLDGICAHLEARAA